MEQKTRLTLDQKKMGSTSLDGSIATCSIFFFAFVAHFFVVLMHTSEIALLRFNKHIRETSNKLAFEINTMETVPYSRLIVFHMFFFVSALNLLDTESFFGVLLLMFLTILHGKPALQKCKWREILSNWKWKYKFFFYFYFVLNEL